MDPVTILTAFIPVLTHGAKALINRFTGGAGVKPATVEEAIQLGNLDIRRLEAIAQLDKVDNTAQWVANIRGLQRPVAVGIILLTYIVVVGTPGSAMELIEQVSNLASAAMFYLFGDRTLMYVTQGGKK